ncbi:hypothetical protein M9H77_30116 [Catharanthus roseus]|uniref:Uncharacterized protein n=1 Tax=Catharanthus roseus TaxID=4058 RepID=A0ACB9ZWP3_CATRO|nr:hypothetical protein M9H77_30116 [Catharanthus roseus]
MRVSSAAGKSKRIKTHRRSLYAANLKEHSGSPKRGHWNQVPASRSQIPAKKHTSTRFQATALPYYWSKQAIDSWGTYQVCPGTKLSGRTPPQSMMRCPRRPIGPHPPMVYAPLQVDPPSESKTRPRHRKRP